MTGETFPNAGEHERSSERRKHRWGKLRNFALAASLLVNGGIGAERIWDDYKLSEIRDAVESRAGYTFSIYADEVDHAQFNVFDRGDGTKELTGTGKYGSGSWESRFVLPSGLDIPSAIERLRSSRLPLLAVRELIDTSSFGEVTDFRGEGEDRKPRYRVTFGNETLNEAMRVKEVYFDNDGKPIGQEHGEEFGDLQSDSQLFDH